MSSNSPRRSGARPPKYCRQSEKGRSDRAVVWIDGKRILLGAFDSLESRRKYAELVKGTANCGTLDDTTTDPTISELLAKYLEYAKKYYQQNDGTMHDHYSSFVGVCRYLRRLDGNSPAKDFGPKKLKTVRQAMIDDDLSRKYINAQVNRIRRIFKWGAVEEMVPGEVSVNLSVLEGLRKGKTEARENATVEPVPDSVVESTLPELSPQVADMVALQRLTGCRPGELLRMKPSDTDRSGDVWFYQPSSHKTEYCGKQRQIPIGPRAQAILQKYLFGRWCFQTKAGTPYRVDSYRIAVQRAAKRAGVQKWSPSQLRHAAATEIRRKFGLEAAQVVLGHSNAAITQIYAERDLSKAAEVARRIG